MPKKTSAIAQIRELPANFWYCNIMEMLERLAFFGVRAIAPLYLIASSSENGLGLNYKEKGLIYTIWALLQCLIPMVSGGYTDRYGYRKSLAVAFTINFIGYLGMAQSKPIADALAAQGWANAGFWVFMIAACLVATGTAIFKPPVQGTVAKVTTEETSSLGWGVFYWVVNIGGALAPMGAALLRGEIDWQLVFYAAALITLLNFLPAFLLYREPERTAAEGKEAEKQKGPLGVFADSIINIFKDLRLLVFLLIFSCFWLMFMQLWDLLPNFIDEWVQSEDVAGFFGAISRDWVLADGRVKPEIIINIDAISIIVLVIPISWMISRMNKVAAMIIGMVISLVGFVGAGATTAGLICCLMVFVFSIGEMACSPTFSAYIGLIAPKDKKALYMGYSNIPFAIGWAAGNLVGGFFYDDYGAKDTLALKHLANEPALLAKAVPAADWSDALEKIPPLLGIERDEAFAQACAHLELDAQAAAEALRDDYRYDSGQIENLALLHLALLPENHEKVVEGLARQAESLDDKDGPEATWLAGLNQRIRDLDGDLKAAGIAGAVHYLPGILGQRRGEALFAVRERLNRDTPQERQLDTGQVGDWLWREYGSDPAVLNNLALEYLAQGTSLLGETAANTLFVHVPEQTRARLDALESRLGLARSKAFDALGAALGDEAELEKALSSLDVASTRPADRLFVQVISRPQVRAQVVATKLWTKDEAFLRELIRSDPKALELVRREVEQEGWFAPLLRRFRALVRGDHGTGHVTEEGVNYHKLAGNKDLIQKALAVKDWSRTPDQAARLLGLSRYEARGLAMADFRLASTVLWDRYDPYLVWVYLAVIGLIGTVGMIIFYFVTRRQLAEAAGNAESDGEAAEA